MSAESVAEAKSPIIFPDAFYQEYKKMRAVFFNESSNWIREFVWIVSKNQFLSAVFKDLVTSPKHSFIEVAAPRLF